MDDFNGSFSELMKDKRQKQRRVKEKKISSIHSLASQYHTLLEAYQVGEVSKIIKQ